MAQERTNLMIDDNTENTDSSRIGEMELLADRENDGIEETGQIKEQIEETRSQMGETIDAIQEKLSFSNISEQVSEHVNNAVESAKDAVYDATIGKAATYMKTLGGEISNTSIMTTAKNNPIPFVLIGLGAGLLAYQSLGGGRHRENGKRRFKSQRKSMLTDGNLHNAPDSEGLRAKVNGMTDAVSKSASSAYDKVSSAAGTAWTGVGDAATQAYSKVGDAGSAARGQYDHYIEENPLAVGAVALALGAAVGFSVPASRYEKELMGEARQDLMDKAQSTASDLLDKGKQVVTEAGRAVSEQAKATISEAKTSASA